MFQRGDDVFFIAKLTIALKAAHGGNSHPRDKVGIFTIRFFDTAPARIAGNIHDRRERLMAPRTRAS